MGQRRGSLGILRGVTALKNAARLRTIASVFARFGFQNVAERIRLGRFVVERLSGIDPDQYSAAERLRMAFEELGPTFVKLGQLLATRPDLVPEDFVEEFKRLHDQVAALPFQKMRQTLEFQYGRAAGAGGGAGIESVFSEIDESPIGAASIAQVYRATLKNGAKVVVKVQRPGIVDIIRNDVAILYFLAERLAAFVPEAATFNPVGIVDEFFKTLELETNFNVEANNIRRFQENFKDDPTVKIPHVYQEYSGAKVLVLEALGGIPLSQPGALKQEGLDRDEVMRAGIQCYFRQVFMHGLFHGDLHAGNLFVMPDSTIGLIDFGIVGRLNHRVRDAIANMFVALYSEDYERLAYEYVDLAPFNASIDVDQFAKDLQDLLGPHFGMNLKNVNLGRLLMSTTVVAAKHKLTVPSDLMLFFKSIVTVEGMGRVIQRDFDLLPHALEFADELAQNKMDPQRLKEEAASFGRDTAVLVRTLPRQVRQFVRRVNHPNFAFRLSLVELEEVKRSLESSSNLIFLGLVIGSLILAGSMTMFFEKGHFFLGLPVLSALFYGLAGALGLAAFRNYIKK
ncbi:MAG: AarF/ABC1/UbiB kinase family protein [Bdellovibrionales bacterium]|jgi:ubiquinone biosynthesis protein|nr:AarF/ABC1/UbiB kinase family protein [Bdellovibrionales bacterium]